MTLASTEFLRRFLLHVLPPGFPRIRYYGLWTNRFRAENLHHCRALLIGEPSPLLPASQQLHPLAQTITQSASRCPRCQHGIMVRISPVPPILWPLTPNTS